MNRVTHLVNTIGKDIKVYGMFRRTSSAKTVRTISDYIYSYLDETSKRDVTEEGKKIKAYDELVRHEKQNLIEGIDYLTKEQRGTLKAYGFLRDDIAKATGKVPLHMENNERIVAAHNAWMERLKYKKTRTYGHKFVLSLDPRLCQILNESGKSVDEHLTQFCRTVMRRYQEKYYPNERIGYLMGIHHDKKHIHAHILLFPTTETGKVLAVTDGSRRSDLKGKRARPHKFMQKLADNLVHKFYEKEFVYPARSSQREVHELTQKKLLTRAALMNVEEKFPDSKDDKWKKVVSEKNRLLKLPEDELRIELSKAYESDVSKYHTIVKRVAKQEIAEQAVEQMESKMAQQREAMDGLSNKLKKLNQQRLEIIKKRQKMMRDLSMWKRLKDLHRTTPVGTFGFNNSDVGRWFYERMKEDDDFGKLLKSPEFNTYLPKKKKPLPSPELEDYWYLKNSAQQAKEMGSKTYREIFTAAKIYRTEMGPPFLRQREEDMVKSFLKHKYSDISDEYRTINEAKKIVVNEIDQAKCKMQILTLDKVLFRDAINKKVPGYVRQYENSKKVGQELGVVIQNNTQDIITKDTQREKVSNSYEEINERIRKILDRLEGTRGVASASVELDDQFNVTLERSKQLKGLQEDAIADRYKEMKRAKESKALEVFFTPKKDTIVRRTRSSVEGYDRVRGKLEKRPEEDLPGEGE